MILLVHISAKVGHSAHSALSLAGIVARERHYELEDGFLAVDGNGEPLVAAQDAEDLLASGAYRRATPQEQNQYHAAKKKAGVLVEGKRG